MPAKTLALSMLMGLVALVSIDLWAYKRIFESVFGGTDPGSLNIMLSLCVLGLLPASTLIVVTLVLLCIRVRRCAEGRPFLLGFSVSGLIGALSFVFTWWFANGWFVETVVTPSADAVESFEGEWAEHLGLVLFACLASIPQFLMAVVGGLAFCRLGLNVHRPSAVPAPGAPDGAANTPNLALQRTPPAAAVLVELNVARAVRVR